LAGVGDCVCAGLAFVGATLFVFTPLPFAFALFETALVAEAFDAAAFVAVPGSATVPEVAGPVATALRLVDFLGGAVVALFATVAFRPALFLVPVRRLEPVVSLGLAASVVAAASFASATAELWLPGLRPEAACLAARFGLLVAPLALVSKASATTASASSKVS
jgi:hypothetical protein